MTENTAEKPRAARPEKSRFVRYVVGIPVALVLLILFVASYLIDGPLRRITEEKINRNLKGYSVRLPKVHFQLLTLTATVEGLTLRQDAHPDPPIITIPMVKTTIQWRAILSGRLVAEALLDQPKININLQQLQNEMASRVSFKERGWQQALADVYPLKMNTLIINDASVIYIDQDPERPLVLSHLNLQANNIRNILQPDQVYPSSFHLDTAIFGSGHGSVDGVANFLAEPLPGIKAGIELDNLSLDYFKPVMARANLVIKDGVMKAAGEVEYGPKVKIAHLKNLEIQGMTMDYIHSQRTAVAEKERAAVVGETAKEISNKPGLLLRVDQLSLVDCTLGFVNKSASKPYRVFLADTDLQLSNFSNQFAEGLAQAHLKAKFMGSGITTVTADFRPEKEGPDFDLYVKIEETRLTTLNDVLRAYGDFDVVDGEFSLVTELHVKNGEINGYVKPFFKDMDVYDRRQDKKQGGGQQLYEKLVGGIARLFENQPRQEIATKADISGPVEDPETNTWQIIAAVIRNAFFKAILPHFEKEVAGRGKR